MELILVHNWEIYHTTDNFGIDVISELEKSNIAGINEVTFNSNQFMYWLEKNNKTYKLFQNHKYTFETTIGLTQYPVVFKAEYRNGAATPSLYLYYIDNEYLMISSETYIIRWGRVYAPEYITFYRQEKPHYSYIKFDYNSEVDPL